METIQNNSVSIILWVIVAAISIRHLYVNWKTFNFAYRIVVMITMMIMLPMLLLSIWSDTALIAFFISSLVLSYVRVYKSRIDRSSLEGKVDDKYLITGYPKQKGERMSSYRTRVYRWYLLHDIAALAFVVGLGSVLSHLGIVMYFVQKVF